MDCLFRSIRPTVCCVGAVLAVTGLASAQQCTNQKLLASDRASADAFGASISGTFTSSGNGTYTPNVAIGAPQDDTAGGVDAGSVYLFARFAGAWGQVGHVLASDGVVSDYFGTSVGYGDPWLVVGAPGAGVGGAAYFYERVSSSFVQKSKILLPGVAAGDDVGRSVSMANNAGYGPWALVAAPLRDVNFTGTPQNPSDPDAGVVMLCVRAANGTWSVSNTWPVDRSLFSSGQYAGEHYGASVSISGDWVAACGAPYGHLGAGAAHSGYVDIFKFFPGNGWTQNTKFSASDGHADDHYGAAVSTNGQFVVIGAPDQDGTSAQLAGLGAKVDNGCVYVQEQDINGVWHFGTQLFASDASNGAHFGSSVEVQGDTIAVGASGVHKTYVFKYYSFGWTQIAAYSDPDGSGSFGSAVTFANDTLVIADSSDSHAGPPATTAQGAAYAYDLPGSSFGPPIASDSCAGATAIGSGTFTGCTGGGATTAGVTTTCGGLNQGPDVWYLWWPSCTGGVVIDTLGSSFDTVLSVHSGCPGTAANTVACNDDLLPGPGVSSRLALNASAGTLYYVRIAGYLGAAGTYTLHIVEDNAPANDTCGGAQQVYNGSTAMSTCHATLDGPTDPSACTSLFGPDVWFRYTATSTGACAISTCGATFDTVLTVYPAACPASNAQAIACNGGLGPACGGQLYGQSLVLANFVAGQSYTIRLSDFPGSLQSGGTGSLVIHPACPCNYNGGALGVQDIFDYLNAWFAGSAAADFDGSGSLSVQDIFDFLNCWFGGCP